MMLKLLKLPLKLISLPAALCLFLVHAACGIILGLSSLVTNLVAGLFIFGAAAGWIAGAPDAQAYQALGIGLAILAAPHVCSWIVGKLADLMYRVLGFIAT